MTIDVLIACAQQDLDLEAELETHLAILRRTGKISIWHPFSLRVDGAGKEEFGTKLATTRLAVILSSSSFWGSDEQYQQLEQVLEHRAAGKLRIVPILARPFNFDESHLNKLLSLPRDNKPVDRTGTNRAARDEAWTGIAKEISQIVADIVQNGVSRASPGAGNQDEALRTARIIARQSHYAN